MSSSIYFNANVCRNSMFQVNKKKNATGRRRLTSSNRAAIFFSASREERHNKPFWLYSLRVSRKKTKLYFSSRVRKQFKLLKVPFKPLSCCLRSDKLVKFCEITISVNSGFRNIYLAASRVSVNSSHY